MYQNDPRKVLTGEVRPVSYTHLDVYKRQQSVCPTNITVSSVYAMLTKRTQTRHITVGNEVMSVSTMEPPHELVGLTVEEAARRLQPESLIALVDQPGEISMTVDLLRCV